MDKQQKNALLERLKERKKQAKSSGFTLVELSIVLVGIGLIIAVLVGASDMIRQAGVRKQIAQLSAIDTGVQNFRVKYSCYPGDCLDPTIIQDYTYSGNGNGSLEATWNDDENKGFWLHLTLTKMIEDSLISHGALAGMQVPQMALTPKSITGSHKGVINAYGSAAYAQNVLSLATTSTTAALQMLEMSNMDQKMDDGIPTSGNVRSAGYYGADSATSIYAAAPVFPLTNNNGDGSTPCISGGVYSTAATLDSCNLIYLLSNN